MYKHWYLLESPTMLSGFESEALDEFAGEGFLEALHSGLGMDVELCNYDLSVCSPIRVIVQNNVANTKSNTLTRQVLAPIGTFKAGMYIKYKNRYWLIVGLVDDNMMYEKAVVVLCNYLATWLNGDGKIIQRWVSAASASQYNNGETGAKYYQFRTDQLMVLTPDDDECLLMQSGLRLIIDNRCKVYEKRFDDSVTVDTSNPVIVYQITRVDSVLFDYQDSGHSEFMAYQDEQHENDGYYVIDGHGYWLCDVPNVKDETTLLLAEIVGEDTILYPQIDPITFTARFCDICGNEVDVLPEWKVESDVLDKLNIEYVDQSILISTDDMSCVNHNIQLTLSAQSYEPTTISIDIKAFF